MLMKQGHQVRVRNAEVTSSSLVSSTIPFSVFQRENLIIRSVLSYRTSVTNIGLSLSAIPVPFPLFWSKRRGE